MEYRWVRAAAKSAFLGLAGFVLGSFGLSAWSGGDTPTAAAPDERDTLATASKADQCQLVSEESEEIFFLSCGGTFF